MGCLGRLFRFAIALFRFYTKMKQWKERIRSFFGRSESKQSKKKTETQVDTNNAKTKKKIIEQGEGDYVDFKEVK